MRELGDGILHDAHKPKTQTGGGGRGSGRNKGRIFNASDDPPERLPYEHPGSFGVRGGRAPLTYEDFAGSQDRVAPTSDPNMYFEESVESEMAQWLRRIGFDARSLRKYKKVPSPDCGLVDVRQTVEFKNPEMNSYLSAMDHAQRASRQSRQLMLASLTGYTEAEAKIIMAGLLDSFGASFDSVIIVLKGGDAYVHWERV